MLLGDVIELLILPQVVDLGEKKLHLILSVVDFFRLLVEVALDIGKLSKHGLKFILLLDDELAVLLALYTLFLDLLCRKVVPSLELDEVFLQLLAEVFDQVKLLPQRQLLCEPLVFVHLQPVDLAVLGC